MVLPGFAFSLLLLQLEHLHSFLQKQSLLLFPAQEKFQAAVLSAPWLLVDLISFMLLHFLLLSLISLVGTTNKTKELWTK